MACPKTALIVVGTLALLALGTACGPAAQPAADESERTPSGTAGAAQEEAIPPGPPTPTPGTSVPPSPPADTALRIPPPSVFEDSANLAAHPSVVGVIVGRVLEKEEEPTLPLTDASSVAVRYGDWRVKVERYLVEPQPYQEVTIRLIERFIRPDGSVMPARFPLSFRPDQQVVLFLSRNLGTAHPAPTGDMFTLLLGPGGQGAYVIRNGLVHTVRHGTGGDEPVDDFVQRIVDVAKAAGRATAEWGVQSTAELGPAIVPPPLPTPTLAPPALATPRGPPTPQTSTPPPTSGPVPGLPTAVPFPRDLPMPPVQVERRSEREFYSPGDVIDLTVTFANVSNETVHIKNFPGTVTLDSGETPGDEGIVVASGGGPRSLAPGESAVSHLTVPGEVSATLPPGRYTVHVGVRFADGRGSGVGGGVVFVLLPPQGALEKTVVVNEVREAEGVRITLRQIEFTRRETRIVSLAVPPGYTAPEGPVSFPRGNMAGKYRVDEGPWLELHAAYRDTQEGVHLEWLLGPVPADAKTFEFAVTTFAINPSQQVRGVWQWMVSLEGL